MSVIYGVIVADKGAHGFQIRAIGATGKISQEQISYFKRIESMNLKSSLLIGFGISDASTFMSACKYANGAILGSSFMKFLTKNGTKNIDAFVKNIVRGV